MLQQPDVKVLKNYMKVFQGFMVETLNSCSQRSFNVLTCCFLCVCVCVGFLPAGQTLKLELSSGAFQ